MFDRLAPPLQRILWGLGWKGLRENQLAAMPLILDSEEDLIIAAATASGKTEAAFLPLLTRLRRNAERINAKEPPGVILYVAPVKALINDQVQRLQVFCQDLDIPVYPWHGDVGQSSRKRFLASPRGIVLITPESLEALIFRRGNEIRAMFATLEAVVVDELHAFIGNVRGCQLQSLLHRLEFKLGRSVQRIGLSATLGDMRIAAEFLRVGRGEAVKMVVSAGEKRRLQLAVKAIFQISSAQESFQDPREIIADELFERLRGENYLIFPAGVGLVEFYADALRKRCEAAGLPLTFHPHHGRLAKSEREQTELELKNGNLPVSAICTTTLEMGIDIGAIKGVVQIGAPQAVSSLCQRIGRAGRREGESAIFWQYCIAEPNSSSMDCAEGLQQDLVQAVALIQLFIAKWYEPPRVSALDYSTLVQQVLSLIGECHGVTAAMAFGLLCEKGPFKGVAQSEFVALLRAMAAKNLLIQDANKMLLHGVLGERLVNHYAFYAAFPESQEYRLRYAGKELGTLPLPNSSNKYDLITFAGRRWSIQSIDHEKRIVDLITSDMGKLPRTGGQGQAVHRRVREEMRSILASQEIPTWLDKNARSLLQDARKQYLNLQLDRSRYTTEGNKVYIYLWEGDDLQSSLAALLSHQGLEAINQGICITVKQSTPEMVNQAVREIASKPCPKAADIFRRKDIPNSEKWDWVLPDDLFFAAYASRALALEEAHALCKTWPEVPYRANQ